MDDGTREQYLPSVERHTPILYIVMASRVMNGIDVDPASCAIAQDRIQADRFFTRIDDGLSKPWYGNVWLSPPYGSIPTTGTWVNKLINSCMSGITKQAVLLTNSSTHARWYQSVLSTADAICFPAQPIGYIGLDGERMNTPEMPSTFAYFGTTGVEMFLATFSKIGATKRLYNFRTGNGYNNYSR